MIGETLYVYGQSFLRPGEGQTKLRFEGTYIWNNDQGEVIAEKVSPFVIAPFYDGEFEEGGSLGALSLKPGTQSLRINRFGPFDVPFTQGGNRVGTFKGTLQAINYHVDGSVEETGSALDSTMEIKP